MKTKNTKVTACKKATTGAAKQSDRKANAPVVVKKPTFKCGGAKK